MQNIKPVRRETIRVNSVEVDPTRWYAETDQDLIGVAAYMACQNLSLNQQGRQADFFNYARMYGVRSLGYSTNTYSTYSYSSVTNADVKLKLNATRAAVDTATAKIAKNRPRPMFLTDGGDWKQKRRAEKLTQYMDGAFDLGEVYETGAIVFRDACIFGTGCMFINYDEDKVYTEPVWIEEIVVDESEAQYGTPRQLHRSKLVHKEVLAAQFPKKAELIMAATSAPSTLSDDMVSVTYSWHLPSGSKAKDGKYVVSLKEGTLDVQEYKKDYFPFVFFRWNNGLRGFYGQGIVENSFSIQLEINSICATIQKAIYFAAVPRVFVDSTSKIITQHIDNRVGSIVKFTGRDPTFSTATANNPEMYNYLNTLWNKVFEVNGLSELSATSNKPAGLDAAVALREYQDIESQRFAIVGQQWEKFYLNVARIFVDMSKDLYTNNTQLMVKAKTNKFIESIKWKDVNLPEDKYILRCFPTNILPVTPAGRLQTVQELIQAGFIDKDLGLDLLDFPDLQKAMSLKNASVDNAMMVLEKIVDEGVYDTPEVYMNLKLCIQLGQAMYLKARNDKVDEERLELLRRFIDDCNNMQGSGQQQTEEEVPQAAPEPTPTSDLIQNTPQ